MELWTKVHHPEALTPSGVMWRGRPRGRFPHDCPLGVNVAGCPDGAPQLTEFGPSSMLGVPPGSQPESMKRDKGGNQVGNVVSGWLQVGICPCGCVASVGDCSARCVFPSGLFKLSTFVVAVVRRLQRLYPAPLC